LKNKAILALNKKINMIKQNEYFDGNVRSLGYSSATGNSTVGVMEPGEYTFTTGGPEVMTIIEGSMDVKIAGEDDWETYEDGQSYEVPGDSSFEVRISVQTSYLCQY
jgi:purine/pyrimidine-nucleoside phosphorylase